MKTEILAECLNNNNLSLTLMPTEQCNFRCTYCYEDFSIGRMNNEVIRGIKNLLSIRIPEVKNINIEWFGGEPLSAKDIVYEISEHIQNEIKGREIHYSAGMTTNGFRLTQNTFRKLLSKGVKSYQISLDGPEKIHDKTRLRIDGSGSFQVIWNNLLALKEIEDDFYITLRIHVTPENYTYLKELCDLINTNFSNDKRFGIFFKCIENLGGSNGGTFDVLRGEQRKQILEELHSISGINNTESNSEKPYVCYASKPNHLVIRANGSIAKCTVVFNDKRNNLGKINSDGTLDINGEKMSLWTRGLNTFNLSELHCPVVGLPSL